MPRCPACRHRFRVPEDEDDGQHACPQCGFGEPCQYCGSGRCAGDCAEYRESLAEENDCDESNEGEADV